LRLLKDGQYLGVYYPMFGSGTHIIVDGAGAKLTIFGYTREVKGSIVVTNGGFIEEISGLGVQSGGDVRVSGPGLAANLVLTVDSGGVVLFDNDASVQSRGAATAGKVYGTLTLDDARYYHYWTHGVLTVYAPDGILEGDGEVEFMLISNFGGTIRPGGINSAGLLAFKGDITNSATASTDIELGGAASNQYDRITVTNGFGGSGTFRAGGTLNVTLINGFEPGEDTFDILDFTTMNGTFDTVNLPGGDDDWDVSKLYTTGEITYEPPPLGTVILIR